VAAALSRQAQRDDTPVFGPGPTHHQTLLFKSINGVAHRRRGEIELLRELPHATELLRVRSEIEQCLDLDGAEAAPHALFPKKRPQHVREPLQRRDEFLVQIGHLEIPIFGIRVAPQRYLERHRLEPRLMHFINFFGAVPLLGQERLDRRRDGIDERDQIAQRDDGH
jgi:hypothetical protein